VTFSGSTTKAPDDPCGAKVQVEVWWEPGGTPAIDLQTTSASKNITQSGPTVYGAFTGTSKHWYIYNYSNPPGYSQTWQFKGQSSKSIDFGPRTEEEECEDANGQWYNDLCNYPSPILISFDRGAASQMTSVEDGVAFDLDADGALDRIGWTAPQTDVGFLALDRNGNGRIDDGSELFGNHTPLRSGAMASNGFEALRELDGDSDGAITISDSAYGQLRLWIDSNHNGVSEPAELLTLGEKALTTIYTSYRRIARRDRYGNRFLYVGLALVHNSNGHDAPRLVFDVFPVIGQ
jgi:hypothetical protein